MRTSINRCHSSLAMCGLAVALVWAQPVLADGRDFRHRDDAVPGLPTEGQDGSMGFRSGIVAVANPYAAEAGARILEAGGNAVDAAVAIAYALNVVEPQSAGIGGGGFMLVHLADSGRSSGRFGGKTFAVDTRERAPAGATPGMFARLNFTQASTSGLSVGVPGMVRGTAEAVESWGKLPLSRSAHAGDPARRRWLRGDRRASSRRPAVRARRVGRRSTPRTADVLLPGWQPDSRRSDRHQQAAGRDAAPHCQAWPGRLLQRRHRARHRRGAEAPVRWRRAGHDDAGRSQVLQSNAA